MNSDSNNYLASDVPLGDGDFSQATDEELLAAVRHTGDQSCINQLIRRYAGRVKSTVENYARNKCDGRSAAAIISNADDLTQQVFGKLWRSIDAIDAAQPLGAWLHTVTIHTVIDFLRARSGELQKIDDCGEEDTMDKQHQHADHASGADTNPETSTETTETIGYFTGILQQAIQNLTSPILRDTLTGIIFERCGYAELARRFNVSQQCVRSNYSRGLKLVEKEFHRLNTKYPRAHLTPLVRYLSGLRRGRKHRGTPPSPQRGRTPASARAFQQFVQLAPSWLLSGAADGPSLGERLADRIRQKGLSFDDAARTLGISVHDLNDLLNDNPPDTFKHPARRRTLAQFLGIAPDDLDILLRTAVPAAPALCVRSTTVSPALMARLMADARAILGKRRGAGSTSRAA